MGQITITLPPHLEAEIKEYLRSGQGNGDLSALVSDALRDYLDRRQAELEIINPGRPLRTLRITPASKGSGRSDVSVNHDKYLAEDQIKDRPKT